MMNENKQLMKFKLCLTDLQYKFYTTLNEARLSFQISNDAKMFSSRIFTLEYSNLNHINVADGLQNVKSRFKKLFNTY